MSFPVRLRELRTKKGASREDVAKIVSKSWHSVAKWETGDRDPGTDDLSLLAIYFSVTTDYLLGRVDNPTDELVPITTEPLDQNATYMNDPVTDDIVDNLKLMSREDKETIRRLTQSIVNRKTECVS